MAQRNQQQGKFIPALIIAVASAMVLRNSGPVFQSGSELNTIPAIATFFLLVSGAALAASVFRAMAGLFDLLRVRTPKGQKGSAGWIKHRWQIWRDHLWFGWGPYWGTLRGKPIFSAYESVAMTIGPPGSGKSAGVVQPMALAIRGSKTIPDYKGNLTAILARPLRERGEDVKIVDLGSVLSDSEDGSDKYNPLCIIVDNIWRAGGVRDMSDDCAELALQLLPEKGGPGQTNKYFRDGARDLLEFAVQICVLVRGDNATLGEVAQMLNDREALLHHALWVAGKLEFELGSA